jgi:ribonuclease D
VQLSFDGAHALVDPLALGRENLQPLARLLADPAVRKLLHGADYDLRVLDRDLGARVANVRDTQIAAQLLDCRTGLAPLLAGSWACLDRAPARRLGQRPLPPELFAFAVAELAHLEALGLASRRLAELDRLAWWRGVQGARGDPLAPPGRRRAGIRAGQGRRPAARRRADRLALHRWREAPPRQTYRRSASCAPGDARPARAPADLAALAKVPGVDQCRAAVGAEVLRVLASPPVAPQRVPRARPGRPQRKRGSGAHRARRAAGELG